MFRGAASEESIAIHLLRGHTQGCHLLLAPLYRPGQAPFCPLPWTESALALQLVPRSQQDCGHTEEGEFPGNGAQGCWTRWLHVGHSGHPSKVEVGTMANEHFPAALCHAPSLPASAVLWALPADFSNCPAPHFAGRDEAQTCLPLTWC